MQKSKTFRKHSCAGEGLRGRKEREDSLPPSCSAFRHLQWLPWQQQLPPSLTLYPGKGPSLPGVVFTPAPSSYLASAVLPGHLQVLPDQASQALMWLLLLEGSRGPGASAATAKPPGHGRQGISCFSSQLCAGLDSAAEARPCPHSLALELLHPVVLCMGFWLIPPAGQHLSLHSCGDRGCPAPLSLAKPPAILVQRGDCRLGRASQRQWLRTRLLVHAVLCFGALRMLSSGLQWQPHSPSGRLISGSSGKELSTGFFFSPHPDCSSDFPHALTPLRSVACSGREQHSMEDK